MIYNNKNQQFSCQFNCEYNKYNKCQLDWIEFKEDNIGIRTSLICQSQIIQRKDDYNANN